MNRKVIAVVLALALVFSLGSVASTAETVPTVTEAGSAAALYLGYPSGITEAADGSLLISDMFHKVVWSVKDGNATVYAGTVGAADAYGEPKGGYVDGEPLAGAFRSPWDVIPWYRDGYAISDPDNHVVRWTNGTRLETAVGTGQAGFVNGRGVSASFNNPTGLATDDKGNLYIADTGNNAIRKVSSTGQVSTYAGGTLGCSEGSLSKAAFCQPTALCWADGALYVADSGNHRICKIQGGKVSTVAGSAAVKYEGTNLYAGDYVDGGTAVAQFDNPQGITVASDGTVYVADTGNSAVRKIKDGKVSTLLRLASVEQICPVSPRGLLLSGDTLYVTDVFSGFLVALPLDAAAGFSDVNHWDWYYNAVGFVCETGLFRGTSASSFSPGSSVDRAMFATVICRFEQSRYPNIVLTGESAFSDVAADKYYADAVAWAADNGIASGTGNGAFTPAAAITREQMAAMLFRYAQWAGFKGKAGADADLSQFPDADMLSDYAVEAMAWAVANGVINGSEGKLLPGATATRAQAAQIFQNFYNAFL